METGQHLAIKQSPKYLYDWKPCALCWSVFFNKSMNEKKKFLSLKMNLRMTIKNRISHLAK